MCAFTAPVYLIPELDPTHCRLPCYVSDKLLLGQLNANIVEFVLPMRAVCQKNQFRNCGYYTRT